MFRKILQNLLRWLLEKIGPDDVREPEIIEPITGELEPDYSERQEPQPDQHESVYDLFQRLTMNEAIGTVLGETIEGGIIADLDSEFPTRIIKRDMTEDGPRTIQQNAFLLTQAGDIIRPEELIGGGKCSTCGAFSDRDNIYICAYCLRLTCRLCSQTLSGRYYCPDHYELALPYLDTWEDLIQGEELR